MNKIVIAIMFSQIAPVVKTIPGKFKKYALLVLTLRIGLPCTGRYAHGGVGGWLAMQESLLLDWLCQAGQHGCHPIR